MKKIVTILLSVVMVAAMGITMAACKSTEVPAKVATSTSYALVHGQGYIGEATAIVDAQGKVEYVELNEYFLPNYLFVAYPDNANVKQGKYTNTVKVQTGVAAPAVPKTDTTPAVAEKFDTFAYYAQYVKIGDKTFECTVNGAAGTVQTYTYAEMGTAAGKITDLAAALKPTGATFESTLNNATVAWYGEACKNAQVVVMKNTAKAGEAVTLAYEVLANGTYGISKRFGTYGSATYNWMDNQAKLEAYVLANGFSFTKDNLVSKKATEDAAKATMFVGEIDTKATETDAPDYLLLMKDACTKAQTAAQAK